MKKRLTIALSSALAVATALPAFALTNEVTGFFRVRGIMGNLGGSGAAATSFTKDQDPDKVTDQRLRAKWTVGVSEYLKVVYFGEIDFQYGDSAYGGGGRNGGGAIGADSVNLETKNVFMEAKIPDTPITATLGLQGFGDNYDYSLFLADLAGLKLGMKLGPVDTTLGWFKLLEGDAGDNNSAGQSRQEDDVTLWAAQLGLKPSDAMKLGLDLYYVQNQGVPANPSGTSFTKSREDLYYVGLNAGFKLPVLDLSAWAYYNFGTQTDAVTINKKVQDRDVTAYAASVRGEAKVGDAAKLAARVFYFSSDDDANDDKLECVREPFVGTVPEALPFSKDGLMIMFADAYQITYPGWTRNGGGSALADAAYAGYGLWGATVNASFTPPAMKKLYASAAVGYFASLEDDRNPKAKKDATERGGTNLGFEVAAHIGYKLLDNLDLSLNGSFVSLGDFYDKTTKDKSGKVADPDSPYLVYWMANVPF